MCPQCQQTISQPEFLIKELRTSIKKASWTTLQFQLYYYFSSEPTHNFVDHSSNQEVSPQGPTALQGVSIASPTIRNCNTSIMNEPHWLTRKINFSSQSSPDCFNKPKRGHNPHAWKTYQSTRKKIALAFKSAKATYLRNLFNAPRDFWPQRFIKPHQAKYSFWSLQLFTVHEIGDFSVSISIQYCIHN